MSKGFSEKINKNICMRRRWSGCRRGRGGVGHSSCRLHCVLLQSPLLFETFSVLSYTRNNHGSSHKPTQAAPQTAGWKSDSVPERLNPNKLCSLSLSLSLTSQESRKRFLVLMKYPPPGSHLPSCHARRSSSSLLHAAAVDLAGS